VLGSIPIFAGGTPAAGSHQDPAVLERHLAALRKAGLKVKEYGT